MLQGRYLLNKFRSLHQVARRGVTAFQVKNELTQDQLMPAPEGIKPLSADEDDIKRIFSVSNFHLSRRSFLKNMFEIWTLDEETSKMHKHTHHNSFIQMYFPFSKNKELASSYVSWDNLNVRFGLILNEMDTLATDVGYKYVGSSNAGKDDFRITTAVIDGMNFFERIQTDQDLKMNGYVMYVSKSSFVVGIDLFTRSKDQGWKYIGNASYILAARTKDNKPYTVPELSFKGEKNLLKCKARFEYGYHVHAQSKAMQGVSEYHASPTDEEAQDIHNLLFTLHNQQQYTLSERRAYVPMSKTLNTSQMVIQPQKNVIQGFAAAGHVLNEAYQIAWITSHLFCERQKFDFVGLDRLYFPVPSVLASGYEFKAKVSYSDKEYFRVNTHLTNIVESIHEEPTIIDFTFRFPEGMGEEKKIMPENYDDALKYLMNKRMMQKFLV
ncbi:unnamed protein product [Moneuplotes crassus]|uniref:HotDog ACOT-type domain-containing protein n=1 Tax=Euplotes crassus TaxID=5936 RepID=A0AAD1UKS7_EUPCR|nr:unnamed protein product [Moneuplotes crassus]